MVEHRQYDLMTDRNGKGFLGRGKEERSTRIYAKDYRLVPPLSQRENTTPGTAWRPGLALRSGVCGEPIEYLLRLEQSQSAAPMFVSFQDAQHYTQPRTVPPS